MKIRLYASPYNGPSEIKLKDVDINVIRPYLGVNRNGEETIDDRVTLVINDKKESFWPCIIWLEDDEALKLAEQLTQAVKFKHENKEQLNLSLRDE